MKRFVLLLVLGLVCMGLFASDGLRYALVMGNGAYQKTTKLSNPVNDAGDVANMLEDLGFKVRLETDATLDRMEGAVREFSTEAKAAKADTTLFFYAGHGVQYEGVNYLLPVDADIQREYELRSKALSMDMITSAIEDAKSDFNLIMLDACRDNPFASSRGGSRGLGVMGGGTAESMVVFATAPGAVAQDGDGKNSPFTTALKQHLATPDLEVRQLVAAVSRSVQDMTRGMQIPWVNTSFTGQFFFLTAQQQLAKAESDAKQLQGELAALEAEIAKRQSAILAETDTYARQQLQLEQQRAKALENSKKLEVQRMEQLREQAAYQLAVQEKELAEKRALEATVAGQQEELARQAEMRRAELAELDRKKSLSSDALQRLDLIAKMEKAITDIQESFALSIAGTTEELERLGLQQISSYRTANPQDPWETNEEFEARVSEYQVVLLTEGEAKIREIERQRDAEVGKIQVQLEQAKRELEGMRFTLGPTMTKVTVDKFDAANKRFPIKVSSLDSSLPFEVSLYFKIESTERDVIQSEYQRVDNANKAQALVGTINYKVIEIEPSFWGLQAMGASITSLLEVTEENQTQLVSLDAENSMGKDADFSIGAILLRKLEYGLLKNIYAYVPIASDMGNAKVFLDEIEIGNTGMNYLVEDNDRQTYEFKFLFKDGISFSNTIKLTKGKNPPVYPRNIVRPKNPTSISFSGAYFSDLTNFDSTYNNGDKKVSAGESIRMDASVHNSGAATVKGVKATFSTTSPYVKFTSGYDSINYRDIAGGKYKSLYSSYDNSSDVRYYGDHSYMVRFTVDKSTPVGIIIPILITFSDITGNTWQDAFSFTVTAPNVALSHNGAYFSDLTNFDSTYNNGDKKVSAGESIRMDASVHNSGAATVKGVKATFSTTSPYVKFTSGYDSISYGDIEGGKYKSLYSSYDKSEDVRYYGDHSYMVRFTVDKSTPVGTVVPMKVVYMDAVGRTWEDEFSFTVTAPNVALSHNGAYFSDLTNFDSTYNNGDKKVSAGESIRMDASVHNSGAATVKGVKATFSTTSPYVKFTSGYDSINYRDIAGGKYKSLYSSYDKSEDVRYYGDHSYMVRFTVDKSTPVGTVVPMKVVYMDAVGRTWEDEFSFTVTAPNVALSHNGAYFSDLTNFDSTYNNGDKKVSAGESIRMDASVHNSGAATVKGVKATFSTTSPYVKFTSGYDSISYGDIEGGKYKSLYSSYDKSEDVRYYGDHSYMVRFTVDKSTPVGTVVPMKVVYMDAVGRTWEDEFSFTVTAPNVALSHNGAYFSDLTNFDSTYNNGDKKVSAGESIRMDASVHNSGAATVKGVKATFSTTSPYVKFTSGYDSINYRDIAGGKYKSLYSTYDKSEDVRYSSNNSYMVRFTVDKSTPVGTVVPMKVVYMDAVGRTWEDEFSFTIAR